MVNTVTSVTLTISLHSFKLLEVLQCSKVYWGPRDHWQGPMKHRLLPLMVLDWDVHDSIVCTTEAHSHNVYSVTRSSDTITECHEKVVTVIASRMIGINR
jgi:hypothetical protein